MSLPNGRAVRRRLPEWAGTGPPVGEILLLPPTVIDRLRGMRGSLYIPPDQDLPKDLLVRRAWDLRFSLMALWLAALRQALRWRRVQYSLGIGAVVLAAIASANAIAQAAPAVTAGCALAAAVLTGIQTIIRAGPISADFMIHAKRAYETAERTRRLMQFERDSMEEADVVSRLDQYTEQFYAITRESKAASD
jgi:hypothetical protein